MAKKPLEIDMCAGSQLRDTQGEMLSVEGADISELKKLNDNHGKGFFNSIGVVTLAKKIFSKDDCEDDRQRYYWDKVKAPYIYVKGFLHDDEDHPNAKAAAAILRNIHKHDVPLKLKASVEGGVISRGVSDNSLLARTKIHSVALTFTPANNATLVEPIDLVKNYDETADMVLIKSVMHLAQSNVPSFRHIARDASATRVEKNLEKIFSIIDKNSNFELPSKRDIVEDALTQKIKNNIHKINYLVKSEKEDLDKGLKEMMVAGALGAASAVASPAYTSVDGHLINRPQLNLAVNKNQVKQQRSSLFDMVKNVFKKAKGQTESSGAIMADDHNIVKDKKSMHYGMRAGGTYGIMPYSVQEMFKHSKQLRKKYPQYYKLAKTPDHVKKNHMEITSALINDPVFESEIDDVLTAHNAKRLRINGVPVTHETLAYAHNQGLSNTYRAYKEDPNSIKTHPYVVKLMNNMQNFNMRMPASVKKALTAGYGGAAEPSSRFGGAALQVESIDKKHKQFKYVTCDNCGKEQIYSKFQVKCRECGKNWSLDKLHKIMSGLKGNI
jgi:hypothetical protein